MWLKIGMTVNEHSPFIIEGSFPFSPAQLCASGSSYLLCFFSSSLWPPESQSNLSLSLDLWQDKTYCPGETENTCLFPKRVRLSQAQKTSQSWPCKIAKTSKIIERLNFICEYFLMCDSHSSDSSDFKSNDSRFFPCVIRRVCLRIKLSQKAVSCMTLPTSRVEITSKLTDLAKYCGFAKHTNKYR